MLYSFNLLCGNNCTLYLWYLYNSSSVPQATPTLLTVAPTFPLSILTRWINPLNWDFFMAYVAAARNVRATLVPIKYLIQTNLLSKSSTVSVTVKA